MARVEIDLVVQAVNATTGVLSSASGASIQVNQRNTDGTSGAAATVFQAATGGSTATNPITADLAGRIEGWLDSGKYNLVVSGAGITGYTQPWDADQLDVDAAVGVGSLRTIGTGALQAAPGTVDAAAGTGSVRTLGTGATQAAPGNDTRFTKTFQTTHAWVPVGTPLVQAYGPFYVGKESGDTLTIERARYTIRSGTNTTFKIQKGGSDLTGYGTTGSPLTATTTPATTTSSQTLADLDSLTLVVLALSGAPLDLAVTMFFKHVV